MPLKKVAHILFLSGAIVGCSAVTRGYAPINGLSMYYETYGERRGTPLLLIHGGASTIESTFGRVIPLLAREHFIVAMEEQAHGRTSDRPGPLQFATSAKDAAALLAYLKIEKADVFGFSNGASIAMHMAIQYPEKIRKLVFASSLTKKSGAPPQLWEMIAKSTGIPPALQAAFLKVNADSEKLRNLGVKTRERMMSFIDTPDSAVRSIKAETLILTGDRDVATLEHTVELVRLIPNARLMVLPAGHGDYMGEASSTQVGSLIPEFTMGLVENFLKEKK